MQKVNAYLTTGEGKRVERVEVDMGSYGDDDAVINNSISSSAWHTVKAAEVRSADMVGRTDSNPTPQ